MKTIRQLIDKCWDLVETNQIDGDLLPCLDDCEQEFMEVESKLNKLLICDVGSSLIVNIKSFGEFIHKLCETDFTKRKKQYKYKNNWYGFTELKDVYRREFLN